MTNHNKLVTTEKMEYDWSHPDIIKRKKQAQMEYINPFQKAHDEYNLWLIEGGFGRGKTVFLAWCAYEFQHVYDHVWTNFPVYLDTATMLDEITKKKLFELNPDPKAEKHLLLLQEAYHYWDKRASMTKSNITIGQALFQIRKLNVDIIADIRQIDYSDFRIGDQVNFCLRAKGKLAIDPNVFEYAVLEETDEPLFNDLVESRYFYLDMGYVFDLYDSFATTEETQDMDLSR